MCKRWAQLIDESVVLRYIVELDAHSKIDGPPSAISTGDRLQALLAHQRAWRDLAYIRHDTFNAIGNSICEFAGSVFGRGQRIGASGNALKLLQVRSPASTTCVYAPLNMFFLLTSVLLFLVISHSYLLI